MSNTNECVHGVPTDTCPQCSLAPALEASIAIVADRDRYKRERNDLARALKECADRFERCCIHSGSDKEFAASAVSDYRAVLAKIRP